MMSSWQCTKLDVGKLPTVSEVHESQAEQCGFKLHRSTNLSILLLCLAFCRRDPLGVCLEDQISGPLFP